MNMSSTNPITPTNSVYTTGAVEGGAAPGVPGVASLMPEPTGGGADVGFAIAQMIIETSFASKKAARHNRQQATQGMISAQKAQIAHLRQEAEKRYDAAVTNAWGKIAGGALGVAGGIFMAEGKEGVGRALISGGDVAEGSLAIPAAGMERRAALESAAAKEAEMQATAEKAALDDANDEIAEAREHIRTALEFLRDFQSTQSKAMSSAIKA